MSAIDNSTAELANLDDSSLHYPITPTQHDLYPLLYEKNEKYM